MLYHAFAILSLASLSLLAGIGAAVALTGAIRMLRKD
jgi:hypothetical protein